MTGPTCRSFEEELEAIFEAGYAAGQDGVPQHENPYPGADGCRSDAWDNGWRAGRPGSSDVMEPVLVLEARNDSIERLVQECAAGRLPFSGPGSLCVQVAAMGFRTTSLHEMVRAAEASAA